MTRRVARGADPTPAPPRTRTPPASRADPHAGQPHGPAARQSARVDRLRRRLGLSNDWSISDVEGLGPFATRATLVSPEGRVVAWRSREHRKRDPADGSRRDATWWAPVALGWWIGVLFAVGSACFALGALPGYSTAVGLTADATTFFVGSLFFTTAAALQYLQATSRRGGIEGGPRTQRRRVITWEPDRIDWWATTVQLLGTVFFNISTFAALHASTVQQMNRRVWTPDVFGSVCFLVASWLAWSEVCHGRWSWPPRGWPWWIAALNLFGSVAFGVSAVAAYVVPTTEQVRNAALMNAGTFVGAVAFLIGAALLLPERTATDASMAGVEPGA